MKWYQQSYVNRRDWILENLENLKLNNQEVIVLLLIDHANSNNRHITLDYLASKLNVEVSQVDKILSVLCTKKYLSIKVNGKQIVFDLSGLFEVEKPVDYQVATSIYDLFEQEFGRPLTKVELEKVNEWQQQYTQEQIIYGLRQSSMYQKLNLAYIQKVLEKYNESR